MAIENSGIYYSRLENVDPVTLREALGEQFSVEEITTSSSNLALAINLKKIFWPLGTEDTALSELRKNGARIYATNKDLRHKGTGYAAFMWTEVVERTLVVQGLYGLSDVLNSQSGRIAAMLMLNRAYEDHQTEVDSIVIPPQVAQCDIFPQVYRRDGVVVEERINIHPMIDLLAAAGWSAQNGSYEIAV